MFLVLVCFFFNDTATTEIYTLSLHDALPISAQVAHIGGDQVWNPFLNDFKIRAGDRLCKRDRILHFSRQIRVVEDRKSTRLNSSHSSISYAVFCLKKKNIQHLSP